MLGMNYTFEILFSVFQEPVFFIHHINQPATGGNRVQVTGSGCHVQSPWTQTGQHGALSKESYPGSYGCRVTSGGHSNLEQSAVVSYICLPTNTF